MYYKASTAVNHTRKMADEIRKSGIKIMSYFISESGYERSHTENDFRTMYGKDSYFVNPTNMMEVAKTMNKKFLEK